MRIADVPILMYHYISASPSVQDRIRYGLSVPPEMFEAQLKLLHDNGFTTITLRDLYGYLAVGTPLPEKPIVLTFDDGYLDNYTNAFPLLKKYGMTGTFFVLTRPADDGAPAYLSWDMIQEMSGAGMDIQLHLRDHLDVRNRPYDWLVFQIVGGRQSIEGHTGKPVTFMAYPSGKWVLLFTTEQGESAAAGPFDASNAIFVADRCNGKAVRLRTAEAILKG